MKALPLILISLYLIPANAKNKNNSCKIKKEYEASSSNSKDKSTSSHSSFDVTQIKINSSTLILYKGLNLKSEAELGFFARLNSDSITPFKNDIIAKISSDVKNNASTIKTKKEHLKLLQKSADTFEFIALPNWSKDSIKQIEVVSQYLKSTKFILLENLINNISGLSKEDVESYLLLVSDPLTYFIAFPTLDSNETYTIKSGKPVHKPGLFKIEDLKLIRAANFFSSGILQENEIKDSESLKENSKACRLQSLRSAFLGKSLSKNAKANFKNYLEEISKFDQSDQGAKKRSSLKIAFDKSTTAQDQEEMSQVGFNLESFSNSCEIEIKNKSNFDYKAAQVVFNSKERKGLFILNHKNRSSVLNEMKKLCKQ